MERLGHWLLNILTIVSLLLLAAVLVLWALSIQGLQDIVGGRPKISLVWSSGTDRSYQLSVEDGRVYYSRLSGAGVVEIPGNWIWFPIGSPESVDFPGIHVGKSLLTTNDKNGLALSAESKLATISLWWPLLLSLPLPARFIYIQIRRRKRNAAKQCLSCGYDLRATPQRCPECGTIAAQR